MKKRFAAVLFTTCFLLGSALGRQQTSPSASQTPPTKENQQHSTTQKNPDEVVRISVTLVQVDVAVTDRKGQPVTDLKPEDFEIYEDGKRRQITNFSYVFSAPVPPASEAPALSNSPPPPPVRLRPGQVERTMALVVDDLTLTLESSPYVRQALKKFVDEQMRPGDLVAIIRTGAGMGALQMFTSDKRILYAAIERVRWSPSSNTLYTFAPVSTNLVDPNRFSALGESPLGKDVKRGSSDPLLRIPERATDEMDKLRREVFSVGTLGALQFVVRALRELPGRKSVVLFSEGLRIYNREQNLIRVRDALRSLTDLANRSSAVIYTIDARGLQSLTMTAADDLSGDLLRSGADQARWQFEPRAYGAARSDDFIESQEGLNYLAQQTGGFFVRNTNDLNGGIRRVLKDQSSYYLIGFVPEGSTFTGGNARGFHDLKVTVTRPDLRVRTRSGFFAISDEETRSLQKSFGQSLMAALTSPFNNGDVGLRLTSMFGFDPQKGPFVSSLLHIDANDLTFAAQPNGQRKVSFEVAAFTFGDNGSVVDQSIRSYVVHMTEREYQHTLRAGIFYRVNLPIKKPGAYQLRTAVRDSASLKIGSANQFIEVPDLKKGRLTLSGMIVRGHPFQSSTQPAGNAQAQMTSTSEGKVEEGDTQASPAVRRFNRGMVLEYACLVYNARLDKATKRAQLETQLRLFRDGQPVFVGKVNPFDPSQQKDLTRLVTGGSLLLGKELQPGDYALQLIVTDRLAREENRAVGQWIDFEIVK